MVAVGTVGGLRDVEDATMRNNEATALALEEQAATLSRIVKRASDEGDDELRERALLRLIRVARAMQRMDVGDATSRFTDAEWMAKVNALTAWTRTWRMPRRWWEGDSMRRTIARQARERVQREIPELLRRASDARARGDVAESDALMERAMDFSRRMQRLSVALESSGSDSDTVSTALANAWRSIETTARDAALDVAPGALVSLSAVPAPVLLALALGLGWMLLR